MRKLITLLLTLSLVTPIYADSILIGTGGYLGQAQIGYEYSDFSFIYGQTRDNGQISLRYDKYYFIYFNVGILVTYSLSGKDFLFNSDKYPSKTYYEETALRFGLSFGFKYKNFYINTNILDSGLILVFNESKYRDKGRWLDGRLWSVGFGYRFEF